jgi:hypothetical protein
VTCRVHRPTTLSGRSCAARATIAVDAAVRRCPPETSASIAKVCVPGFRVPGRSSLPSPANTYGGFRSMCRTFPSIRNLTEVTSLGGTPVTRACHRTGLVSSAPSAIDELTRPAGADESLERAGFSREPHADAAAAASAIVASSWRGLDIRARLPPGA